MSVAYFFCSFSEARSNLRHDDSMLKDIVMQKERQKPTDKGKEGGQGGTER